MYQYDRATKIALNWKPGPQTMQTPYNSATVTSHVPELAGVYILAQRGTDGKYRSFYVGQANNLQRRLLEHLLSGEPNVCIRNRVVYACGFQIALVVQPAHRDAAEAAIYHAHPDWYACNDLASVPPLNPYYDVEIGF